MLRGAQVHAKPCARNSGPLVPEEPGDTRNCDGFPSICFQFHVQVIATKVSSRYSFLV